MKWGWPQVKIQSHPNLGEGGVEGLKSKKIFFKSIERQSKVM